MALEEQSPVLRARIAFKNLIEYQIVDFNSPIYPFVSSNGLTVRQKLKLVVQQCVNCREIPSPNVILALLMAICP